MRGFAICQQGGKAAQLCALRNAGFLVPDFEVSPPDLATATARLGFPLAVRSSATLEDGEQSSFAGIFSSFLNLHHLEEVSRAVEQCLDSLHSPEVDEYCRQQGVDRREMRMEYIVQRMVEPELAGVVFTVDPVSGGEEPVINAVEGLADELMAGRKASLPPGHPVLQRYLPAILATARDVERHFGRPQDIEFACAEGRVYLLQARPITRINFAGVNGEWTNANFRDGGVSSGVCSPLMTSLYELIWESSLKRTFRETYLWTGEFISIRSFFGRPYWNLAAVKEGVALIPGFIEREFDDDLGIQGAYDGSGRMTPFTWRTVLRAIPIMAGVRTFLYRQERAARKLLQEGESRIAARLRSVPQPAAWRSLVEQDYFDIESTYFRTVFAVSLVKQDFKRSFPGCDYSELVAGLPPLRHLAPLQRMRSAPPQSEAEIAELLREFPHPSRWGLDIRFPRWDEEPEFVADLWRMLPPVEIRSSTSDLQTVRDRCLETIPRRRHRLFSRKLDQLRKWVWLREELRDVSTRMYHLMRRTVLHFAYQRDLGEDIFFMTYQEIQNDDRSQIQSRKAQFLRYRHFDAPNEIGNQTPVIVTGSNTRWRGIAASAGVASGPARVARSIDEASRLPSGCVLVCPFTEPSWTPVLDRCAAVIAETGGQLSHAAVLCREFGIPAVLGVANATRVIRDGTHVIVHGSEGWVAVQTNRSTGAQG